MRLLKKRAEYEMYADVILVSIDNLFLFLNFDLIRRQNPWDIYMNLKIND